MTFSIIRFWLKGWIKTLYIDPKIHFSYLGFEWVKPFGEYTYILFFVCGLSSFFVAIGYRYLLSIIIFFLSFTYIELMDKTTYLNHYYFVSILSFLLIFLPANASHSLDNLLKKRKFISIPKWNIDSIKLLLAMIYIFAGIAKINSDWLFKAMPLKIWLQSKYDLPIIGETLMQKDWFHYFMSWGGMVYDLTIPFLLLWKKTRLFGFLLVIFFHLFTGILFPIGMFPYIMIVSSIIFFDSDLHKRVLNLMPKLTFIKNKIKIIEIPKFEYKREKSTLILVLFFFLIQLIVPFRYMLYPGELFWNEQGYRFSWRVMLIEKKGESVFRIYDKDNEKSFYVQNENFLTPLQEKQMSFQPDLILEYAHYLGNYYSIKGIKNIEVYVDSHVALNGRLSQRIIDPNVDLFSKKRSYKHKSWILPLNDEIKGF